MVVVDRFSKIAHFVQCHKIDDGSYIVELHFKDIIRLHGVPKSTICGRDSKFLSHIYRHLWEVLGTKLLFSTTYHP